MSESSRIVALKQAVESALKSGLSETEILSITKAEVSGAAKLRAAIQDCQAPNRVIRMSYYEQVLDKRIENAEIFAAVNQAVQKPVLRGDT